MESAAQGLNRTKKEILERIEEVGKDGHDPSGVERSRLLQALSFEDATEAKLLRGSMTKEDWEADSRRVRSSGDVLKMIRDSLVDSWIKANGSRGMSVMQFISHFKGLLWLLNTPESSEVLDLVTHEFKYYGKPSLVKISEFVGFDWRFHDNDQWMNSKNDEPLTADAAMGSR